MIKIYNKTKESEYIDIINKFKFPEEVSELIQQYVFDINIFKLQWFNRMINSLSILDKGYKLVPVLNFIENKNKIYCMECYLECFVNKTTYMISNYCSFCEQYINRTINFKNTNFEFISYNEMINKEELHYMYYLYGFKIDIILKSSKLLSEFILLNKAKFYQTKFVNSGLKYEIIIPSYWKVINKKIKLQYRLQ